MREILSVTPAYSSGEPTDCVQASRDPGCRKADIDGAHAVAQASAMARPSVTAPTWIGKDSAPSLFRDIWTATRWRR
ncbi:hypothetical protein GCM10010307_70000 [Streptomyces vastus]|uniref:DUF397 domain-containing protein n=1 Tax=Streptomyces vastus TaxID=285451 RepID=A0ABN3RML5_9ACTN